MGHSTEGRWLANQIKGQSHWLSSLKGKKKEVNKNISIYILKKFVYIFLFTGTMKTKTEALGRQRAEPSKIKAQYSQPTCENLSYHCAPL